MEKWRLILKKNILSRSITADLRGRQSITPPVIPDERIPDKIPDDESKFQPPDIVIEARVSDPKPEEVGVKPVFKLVKDRTFDSSKSYQ